MFIACCHTCDRLLAFSNADLSNAALLCESHGQDGSLPNVVREIAGVAHDDHDSDVRVWVDAHRGCTGAAVAAAFPPPSAVADGGVRDAAGIPPN